MIDSMSFCIIGTGQSPKVLARCLASIHRQDVPEYEILISRDNGSGSHAIYSLYPKEEDKSGSHPTANLRDELCKRASKEYLVLMDPNMELAKDWYRNLRKAEYFDVIGTCLEDSHHRRIFDWTYFYPARRLSPVPLHDDEWIPGAFIHEKLIVLRRKVWEFVKFEKNGTSKDFAAADFCRRATNAGFRIGFHSDASATYHGRESCDRLLGAHARKKAKGWADRIENALYKGYVAFDQKKYSKCLREYQWALKLEPTLHEAEFLWSKIGWAYYFQKRYKKASRAFTESLKLSPRNQDALRGMGWMNYQLKRFPEALRYFNRAMNALKAGEDQMKTQETLRGRGWTYYRLGRYETAIEDFTAALPSSILSNRKVVLELLRGLGWSYLALGEFEQACAIFDQTWKRVPPDSKRLRREILWERDLLCQQNRKEWAYYARKLSRPHYLLSQLIEKIRDKIKPVWLR
ncbi:MAG: tetratricopeptide repeat protein [Candidatus Omnitrophica bacterium]|nr:tetratricopeptide repeat protein [Candidatus Omnitrophota bacterium]